jgi:hypothetical protein
VLLVSLIATILYWIFSPGILAIPIIPGAPVVVRVTEESVVAVSTSDCYAID